MRNIVNLFAFAILCILTACVDNSRDYHISSLEITPATAIIKSGQSVQLTFKSTPSYTDLPVVWSSENKSVASVDENGLVLGIKAGTVYITCSYGSITARAAVKVSNATEKPEEPEEPEKPEEPEEPETPEEPKPEEPEVKPDYCSTNISTEPLSAMLTKELIFSSRQLRYPGTVMQCFDFHDPSEDGYIYFTQCGGDSTTGNRWVVVLSRVKRGAYGDTTVSGEAMFLRWFGHGTTMCVEKATDGGEDFIWLNSNGTLKSGSTDYGNNMTICRLRFEPNKTYEHYTGENFYLGKYTDPKTGKSYTTKELQVNIDFKYRRMLLTVLATGGRHLIIYDLDQALALKEKQVSVTRTWGGEGGTNTTKTTQTTTLMARDLGELTPISSFIISSTSSTNYATTTWSLSYQGHAIFNDLIFWWEGQAVTGSSSSIYDKSCAYLEIFDFNGKRVLPRKKVAAASDFDAMKSLIDLNDNCYVEAEGVQCRHGKLYLGITTHMANLTSKNRRSTILEYDISK